MPKLNQIIAVEKSVKSKSIQDLAEAHHAVHWQRQPRHAKALALGSAFAVELQTDREQTRLSRYWFKSSPPRHHGAVA
jgi:hypothetical protein